MKKPLVVILAGGLGRSFEPISVNKTLLPLHGKPILQHVIEMVEQGGFHEALVVTNTENEAWLSSYQPFNITLQTQIQDRSMGMADALLLVEREVNNDPILVINAVDLIDPLFFKLIHKATLDSYAFVTGLKVSELQPAGYLQIEGNKARGIVEKPAKGQEPSDMINLVFHYFSQPAQLYLHIKNTPESEDRYERALSALMKEKGVDVIPYTGYWQKLKYSYQVLNMMDTFLQNRIKKYKAPTAYVSPLASIEGDVFIDDHAHIESFAVIKGPAYIGKHVRIGNHTLVRQSMIERESTVGFGSEVARSYIGPNCMLHHNFIGDSILESNVNPSWGTTTANLRLDGQNVRLKLKGKVMETDREKLGTIIAKGAFLGVNCSIMPGVTIGKNAQVKPGTVVSEAV
jgi:bifunctional UDP-N-acetylglucosamine pyrophosphorylase/glucosamine-1-phosphate N-acetyltransferase